MYLYTPAQVLAHNKLRMKNQSQYTSWMLTNIIVECYTLMASGRLSLRVVRSSPRATQVPYASTQFIHGPKCIDRWIHIYTYKSHASCTTRWARSARQSYSACCVYICSNGWVGIHLRQPIWKMSALGELCYVALASMSELHLYMYILRSFSLIPPSLPPSLHTQNQIWVLIWVLSRRWFGVWTRSGDDRWNVRTDGGEEVWYLQILDGQLVRVQIWNLFLRAYKHIHTYTYIACLW